MESSQQQQRGVQAALVLLFAVLLSAPTLTRAQDQVPSSNVIAAVCATPDTKLFCQVLKQAAKADAVVALLGNPYAVLSLFVTQDRGFNLTRKLLQTSLGVPDVPTLLNYPPLCAKLVRANLALGSTLPVAKWRTGTLFYDSWNPPSPFTAIIGKRNAAYIKYQRNIAKIVRRDWRVKDCRMQVTEVPLYPL